MINRMKSWMLRYVDYKKLEPFAKDEMKKGGMKEGFYLVMLSQLVDILALVLSFPLLIYFNPAQLISSDQIAMGIIPFVFDIVASIVVFYTISLFMFLVSSALGGKGTLDSQLYLLGLMAFCGRVLIFPFTFILSALEPTVFFSTAFVLPGVVLLGLYFLTLLYGIYASFIALRTVHAFSSLRACAAILIPLISFFILLVLVIILGMTLGSPA